MGTGAGVADAPPLPHRTRIAGRAGGGRRPAPRTACPGDVVSGWRYGPHRRVGARRRRGCPVAEAHAGEDMGHAATLHVLPAADLGTWIAGLGIWKPGAWPLKDLEAIPLAGYIDNALRGKILTRAELAAAVAKLGATPEMVEGVLGSWGGTSSTRRFSDTFASRRTMDNRRASLIQPRGCAGRRPSSTTTKPSTCSLRAIPRHVRSRHRPRPWPLVGDQPRQCETQAGGNRRCGVRKSRSKASGSGC